MIRHTTAYTHARIEPRVAARSLLQRALLALACLFVVAGVACKNDGSSDPDVPLVEGTYANAAPSMASAGSASAPDCPIDFDAFAIVESGVNVMLLPGLGGGSGNPIPGTLTEEDQLIIDYEATDVGTGTVSTIVGTLDASSDDQLVGSITAEITPISDPTLLDCGPTVFAINASRSTTGLPSASTLVGQADGLWLVSVDEFDTTCSSMEPPFSFELAVVTDVDNDSAVLTYDEEGEIFNVDAILTDDFIVTEFNVDNSLEDVRNLTAVRYEFFSAGSLELLLGANTSAIEDDEGSCTAWESILGIRPPPTL